MKMKPVKTPFIFLVEDNSAFRFAINLVLQEIGFNVMLFKHGEEVTEILKFKIPDLILSDIEMPCMDGFELHEHVQSHYAEHNIPFIYLSATTERKKKERASMLGAVNMLKKPVSAKILKENIVQVLNLET